MSHPREISLGMLFASVLYNKKRFSKEDFVTQWMELYGSSFEFFYPYFPMKKYYSKEMGEESDLERFFIFSNTPVERTLLIDAKTWSYKFEKGLVENDRRVVNIDPGLLTLEQMTLSTFKAYAHRIYLGRGVFSDLNYTYQKKSYQKLDWTYPDYARPEIIQAFNHARAVLQELL